MEEQLSVTAKGEDLSGGRPAEAAKNASVQPTFRAMLDQFYARMSAADISLTDAWEAESRPLFRRPATK